MGMLKLMLLLMWMLTLTILYYRYEYLWGGFEMHFYIGPCYYAYWVYLDHWAFDFELPLLTETLNSPYRMKLWTPPIGWNFEFVLLVFGWEVVSWYAQCCDVHLYTAMLSVVRWDCGFLVITVFWRLGICINNLRFELGRCLHLR
jgi:hypothetical protein